MTVLAGLIVVDPLPQLFVFDLFFKVLFLTMVFAVGRLAMPPYLLVVLFKIFVGNGVVEGVKVDVNTVAIADSAIVFAVAVAVLVVIFVPVPVVIVIVIVVVVVVMVVVVVVVWISRVPELVVLLGVATVLEVCALDRGRSIFDRNELSNLLVIT